MHSAVLSDKQHNTETQAVQTQSGSSCSSRWGCLPWSRDHTRCREVALQRGCCCCRCSCCRRCCNLVSTEQALDDAWRLQRPPATRHARVDILQEIVHVPCRCVPKREQGTGSLCAHVGMTHEHASYMSWMDCRDTTSWADGRNTALRAVEPLQRSARPRAGCPSSRLGGVCTHVVHTCPASMQPSLGSQMCRTSWMS